MKILITKKKYPDADIYSEYELSNGDKPDICVDLGSEKVFYEVQKEISPAWLESIKIRDLNLNINTMVIPLKELSDNLNDLIKELEELIA